MKAEKSKGFTLVEVLVAVLILSVGLLGIAGMQGLALTTSNNSYYRSTATVLGNEMLDIVRVNKQSLSFFNAINTSTTDYTDPGCSTCTPLQMAAVMTAQWEDKVEDWLPDGVGTAVYNLGELTVTLSWSERDAGGVATQSLTFRSFVGF